MKRLFTEFSINNPWSVIIGVVLITAFFAAQLPDIKIDTDPENMLEHNEPARLFDHQVKEDFSISEFIAVGVVDEKGAFNKQLLTNVYRIMDEVAEIEGVIADDILAPSMVEDIIQTDGILEVKTLLEDEPESDEQAQYILARIKDNPMLRGKLASDNGKAIAMFIPI
ncbi:MAG: RND transporter, partial [candidate division Zixibacteria bacterium]|nr:RND transporter [candidate division Zixibacteria bacterium]